MFSRILVLLCSSSFLLWWFLSFRFVLLAAAGNHDDDDDGDDLVAVVVCWGISVTFGRACLTVNLWNDAALLQSFLHGPVRCGVVGARDGHVLSCWLS